MKCEFKETVQDLIMLIMLWNIYSYMCTRYIEIKHGLLFHFSCMQVQCSAAVVVCGKIIINIVAGFKGRLCKA